MFPRVLLVTAVVNRALSVELLLPLLVMGTIVYASSALLWRASRGSTDNAASDVAHNPVELRSALQFGALLAVVMLAAEGLEQTVGEAGLLALAGVSGVTDVDAITLSLSEMSTRDVSVDTATTGIVIAAAVNSLVKGGLSTAVGGVSLGKKVLPPLVIAACAGLVWVWLA
jgi:uncharacterized membrane protein (DUF4010 family)